MAAMETNPLTSKTETLLNIATGPFADRDVKEYLLNVKEFELNALSATIAGNQTKNTHVVRLCLLTC